LAYRNSADYPVPVPASHGRAIFSLHCFVYGREQLLTGDLVKRNSMMKFVLHQSWLPFLMSGNFQIAAGRRGVKKDPPSQVHFDHLSSTILSAGIIKFYEIRRGAK
jgi:hypothetical protein